MRKLFVIFLLLSMLTLTTASFVLADDGQPHGGCPGNFQLHLVMEHEPGDQGQHHHVGNDRDLNGDGYICGKHISADGSVHVHIDNNVPLP